MTKEALKMALEALEIGYDAVYAEAQQYHYAMSGYRPNTHKRMDDDVQKIAKAITAIKEALAQQQEPVAWLYNGKLHEIDPSDWATGTVTPLYPSAQFSKPWVGLTEEQKTAIRREHYARTLPLMEAVEQALMENNT